MRIALQYLPRHLGVLRARIASAREFAGTLGKPSRSGNTQRLSIQNGGACTGAIRPRKKINTLWELYRRVGQHDSVTPSVTDDLTQFSTHGD